MGRTFSLKKIFTKKSKNGDEPSLPKGAVDIDDDANTETDKSSDSLCVKETSMVHNAPTPDNVGLPIPSSPEEETDSATSPIASATTPASEPEECVDEGTATAEQPQDSNNKFKQRTTDENVATQTAVDEESLTLCQGWCLDDLEQEQKYQKNNTTSSDSYPGDCESCDGCALFEDVNINESSKNKKYNNNEISDDACDAFFGLKNSDQAEQNYQEQKQQEKSPSDHEVIETGIFCSWF